MIDFKTFAHLAHIYLGEPQPKPTSLEGDQMEAANTLWTSEDGKIEVGVWECSQGGSPRAVTRIPRFATSCPAA
ncbi:hypothetical protein [Mesorhizobium sp.]|uniref:hypothetical protein n=1 Tax=Mesorhizobium sp. TaxID=1871066 RepID=UPI0025811B01|nr:hypothetical protein [Mesorhizobium sp.]